MVALGLALGVSDSRPTDAIRSRQPRSFDSSVNLVAGCVGNLYLGIAGIDLHLIPLRAFRLDPTEEAWSLPEMSLPTHRKSVGLP